MYWNKLLVSSTKARTLVVVRLSGPCAALLRSWSTRRPPHCLRGLRRTSPLLLFYEKIPLLNLPTFSRPVTSSMVLGLFYWSVWKCPRTLLDGTYRAKFQLAMRYWSRQTRSDLCASKCNYFTNCLIFHHFMVNFFFVFCDGLIVHKMPLKKHHTKIKSVFFGYLCPFWVKHFGGVDHVDRCCCGGDLDHGCMYK